MKNSIIIKLFSILLLVSLSLTGCTKSSDTYQIINISDDKTLIQEMPKTAKAGETVTIKVAFVTDAVIYVHVNENPDFGKFVDESTYVFIMPAEDVAVKAGVTTAVIGPETTDATPTPESTPMSTPIVADGEYNILKDMFVATNDGIVYFYGNDFLLVMPESDEWAYEQDSPDAFTIYHVPSRNAGCGGLLVTIKAFDLSDTTYTSHPHYQEAGIGMNTNKRFVAFYPTDVQSDISNEDNRKSYEDLYAYLIKIGTDAVNSPFQTSDSD